MSNTSNATNIANEMCAFMATEAQCNFIMSVHTITATASIVSCIYIFLLMWFIRPQESGQQKCSTELMIQHLAIAVGLSIFHYTWGNYVLAYKAQGGHSTSARVGFCRFAGWLDLFSSWLANSWIVAIAIYTCRIKNEQRSPLESNHINNVWKKSLIAALIISLIPFFVDGYGPSGIWCWIRIDGRHFVTGILMQLLLYYASSSCVFIVMGVYLVYSYRKFIQKKKKRKEIATYVEDKFDDDVLPLVPLPWIFFGCFVFALINRVRLMAKDDDYSGANVFFWFLIAFFPESPGWMFAVWITICYRKQLPKFAAYICSCEWITQLCNFARKWIIHLCTCCKSVPEREPLVPQFQA